MNLLRINKFKFKNNKGFTLIELLIYMSISTIIVAVLTSFIVDVSRNAAKTKITKEVQQNARILLSRMTQEIRNAKTVESVAPQQITIKNYSNQEITFCLFENKLRYFVGTVCDATTNSLSGDNVAVTNLIFGQNTDTISINLTVGQNSGSINKSVTLSSAVVPRSSLY